MLSGNRGNRWEMRLHCLLPLLIAAALAPAFSAARADDDRGGLCDESEDHERALAAVTAQAILPLSAILDGLGTAIGGTLIEVELDCDNGRPLYVLEVRTPVGRLIEIVVDAVTGLIVPDEGG